MSVFLQRLVTGPKRMLEVDRAFFLRKEGRTDDADLVFGRVVGPFCYRLGRRLLLAANGYDRRADDGELAGGDCFCPLASVAGSGIPQPQMPGEPTLRAR